MGTGRPPRPASAARGERADRGVPAVAPRTGPAVAAARGAGVIRTRRPSRPVRPPVPHPSGARPPRLRAELVPRHVAVIMDGNGRWAKARGLPRTAGHEAGEASLLDCVHGAIEAGIRHLSAYAFSTENWRRSPD